MNLSKLTLTAVLALSSVAGCGSSSTADTAKTDAAKAYPAQALTVADLKGLTIGVPPGGKIAAPSPGLEDRNVIETADYNLIVKAGNEATFGKVKEMIGKMKTFKGNKVDGPDGFIAQMDEPSGTQFMVNRLLKVGDKTVSCDSAAFKPLKTLDKAQEAYAVCGTLKK